MAAGTELAILIRHNMTTLDKYGWNTFHAENAMSAGQEDLSIGRVTSIRGFKYYLISEGGEIETELSGRLLYGTPQDELPKVGDWVRYMAYN